MTKLYLSLCRYAVLLMVVAANIAYGQSKTVTGKVTSGEDGTPIPGVNIIEKGTNNGTVTDVDGQYTIAVASTSTLVYSFVGFTSSEVTVGNQSKIDVAMKADVTSLAEVVVVGYGTQEKKELTSAVTSVKPEDFNKGTVNDPAQLLQGKVAGLNIAKAGNDPNGGYNIRLRGIASFGANTEPLIVIDGVIGGNLNTVDPNDIASIDVLKDGSAAAIYGSRGGSGVILITTKSGKAGKTVVEYNGSVALETIANTIDVMSADEYRALPGAKDFGSNTDWMKEVTDNGYYQVHNLAVSGGAAGTSYRAAVNYRDANGIAINSGFQQINGRFNVTQKALRDRATFTFNLSTTRKKAEYGFLESLRYAIISNPTMPVYDNQRSTDSETGGGEFGGYAERGIFDYFNPVGIAELNKSDGVDTRLLGSIRGEYDFSDILPGFRASVFYSSQSDSEVRGQYFGKTSKWGGYNRNGLANRLIKEAYAQLFETTLNYDKNIGTMDMALLGGYSYQYFVNDGFGMQGGNFLTDAFTYNNMGTAQDFDNGLGDIVSYKNSNKLVAFFGRANLNFSDNYFVSVSARYEGSSRFGANNKWGLFPAASAGVTLSNLIEIPAVNSLKIRGSYGVTGNQPRDSYQSLQRFGQRGSFFYNGKYVPSYGPVSNANPDLKWETKTEYDFGADFSMFDNKLTGTADYYFRNTNDLLLTVNVPVPPNLYNQTLVNIGELKNSGFEFAVNYAAISKPTFTWTTGANFATMKTRVESLSEGKLSVGEGGILYRANMGSPGQNDTRLVRVKEGTTLGQLWGPVQSSVASDGNLVFEDLDGDGKYCNCDDDKTVIGNGLPKLTVGWTNSFTFGHFDANIFIRGSFGHDLLNSYRGFYENTEPTTVINYNVVNTKYFDPSVKKAIVNSVHVEKGDFVKLDNMSIGYNFPMTGKAVSKLRLYVAGQNLFTITNYTGVDPEVRYVDTNDTNPNGFFPPDPDPLSPGIERRSTYFTTRTYTFGLNLTF
ncbi:SusC/RagA family TonB-linked outer membrane protein [Chryseolinea sp. T2]|uniref:SusC/RagA family TonB-linked outer membrane protein n=1 Tax=Chryseolinea sp. T2 TaxID=3129255 RepID=UPI0030788A5F